MSNKNIHRFIAYCLIALPLFFIIWKFNNHSVKLDDLMPKQTYTIAYEFDLSAMPTGTFVKAYLPKNKLNQKVSMPTLSGDTLAFSLLSAPTGDIGFWKSGTEKDAVFQYAYTLENQAIAYDLAPNLPFENQFSSGIDTFLAPSEHIQSTNPMIDSLAQQLKAADLLTTLQANFDFVNQITNSNTGVLTDAVTTLRRNRASCNGKSRLFVALCRAQGIPSRVVGGIILENTRKRTSHLWASVYYQGSWIPFDVLNQHFAKLPANYLELYTGDNFLITHTKGINFDYQFHIKSQYAGITQQANIGPQLWPLLNTTGLPLNLLRGLLLLPIVAVVIAILRNVVGFKTFGIFLPALIALGLTNVNLAWGIFAFLLVIAVIAILHYPLEKFGLLHTPKLVIMMTFVVITLLGLSLFGIQNNWQSLSTSLLLPVIVLSITAERFAKTLVEEQLPDALKMLGFTFLIAAMCYPIFQSNLLIGVFLNYPESYFMLLGIMILLGRWIGLRVLEYNRFAVFAN